MYYVYLCKQKTAYEMRISDCSSDVCSSDLLNPITRVNHPQLPLYLVCRGDQQYPWVMAMSTAKPACATRHLALHIAPLPALRKGVRERCQIAFRTCSGAATESTRAGFC